MESWVKKVLRILDPSLLSAEQDRLADETKQRTLKILQDAKKKKEVLLVDNPDQFGGHRLYSIPLISTQLVEDMIREVQEVRFKAGGNHPGTIAYVRSANEDGIVYLCTPFWQQKEFLGFNSRPETLIHEISHLLGYQHSSEDNAEKVKLSQQHMLCPVSAYSIENAFSIYMNHRGTYINGSYSCCGERSRDTVCEKSIMSSHLRKLRERRDKMRDLPEAIRKLMEMKEMLNDLRDLLLLELWCMPFIMQMFLDDGSRPITHQG
ncbi:uncharacterized protein [Hyperolius riggenbachi]|uniref:uncharacterized protein n=1 Tax=Hyperolius riggenbachi TaxID=752182 RepID=UPI0035A3C50C